MLEKLKQGIAGLRAQWARVKAEGAKVERAAEKTVATYGMRAAEQSRTERDAEVEKFGKFGKGVSYVRDPSMFNTPEDTHRVRELRASYRELVKTLGHPDEPRPGKPDNETIQWVFREEPTGHAVFIYAEPEAHGLADYTDDGVSFARFRKAPTIGWSIQAKDKDIGTRFLAWFRKQKSGSKRAPVKKAPARKRSR